MFSPSVERAIQISLEAHAGQQRKGDGGVPYVVHPIHVALLLARWGQDDTTIQAALLHDVVEDSPDWPIERLEREFGARVAAVVGELTEDKSLSWQERKEAGVRHVARMSSDAACVKAGDALHNLESVRASLLEAADADAVWQAFRGGREGTLDVARRLVAALERRVDPRIGRALRSALDSVEELDGSRTPAP